MAKYKARTVDRPDLTQFGLNPEQIGVKDHVTDFGSHKDELFRDHEKLSDDKQWWKSNFFLSSPVLFGAWDGVYTSCVIHLFGVITFLRSGWIVGNAGIVGSTLIVLLSIFITTVAVSAGIGITDRCRRSGNVHFLLSHVLGSRLGGSICIVYCFGQAVSCALHVMGFAEAMASLLKLEDDGWFERELGMGLVVLLLVINIAGVKWVVRLQFLLLLLLLFAALDFAVGIGLHTVSDNGALGFSMVNLERNLNPNFENPKVNLFVVFGIFFPAVTGVFSGINMSGDLDNPRRDIPRGTYSAIATASFLYLLFTLGLGATCAREALIDDYMIAQKVAAVGYFLLAGLYISSLSSCLGAIYATPRIIQAMAQENILPGSRFLSRGQGPNKVPIVALVLFAIVTFGFIMIRKLNVLATIVTIPFLMTYASIEYAYFALAVTFDIVQQRELRIGGLVVEPKKGVKDYGAFRSDVDMLFPERMDDKHTASSSVSSATSSNTESFKSSPITSPDDHSSLKSLEADANLGISPLLDAGDPLNGIKHNEIFSKSGFCYSFLTNRWVAIMTAIFKITIMFLVHWAYSVSAIAIATACWLYIGQFSPGVNPGISQFNLWNYLKALVLRSFGKRDSGYQQIIVPTGGPTMDVTASQLTAEGSDFSTRQKYHHTARATIKPLNQ
ncbi:Solute carrier family 12 member 8 [Halotydeus destructor]|nr:Solute carrier family 12 member 8 [Halotydeus destructor]